MDLKKETMLPLIEHRCSEKVVEGFFQSGTRYLDGHVIEHIALEIQTLAGIHTGFAELETKTLGTYNVVFSYTEENVVFAAESAVAIAES
jgi:cyanophycin synthetase